MIIPDVISEEQLITAVKKEKRPKVKLALMLGFYQCLRVSEVAKLQPEDVDRQAGFIHVRQGKGGKDRKVPIMQPVMSGLRHLPIGVSKRQLQRYCKSALGVKFHTLRHSGATFYLNVKKRDVRQIQQLLGHSRLDTTQIYTHVTPDSLKEAFRSIW